MGLNSKEYMVQLMRVLMVYRFVCFCRSQVDIDQFAHTNQITLKGRDIPAPLHFFEEAGFPDFVMSSIRKQGFEKPTAIQSVGWPIALSGRDMVGIAQTGSGKTLAVSSSSFENNRVREPGRTSIL